MCPCRVLGCGSPAAHQGEVTPGPGPQCSLRLAACHANAWPVAAEQPGCPQRRAGRFPASCLWGRVKESPSSCHIWGLWSLLPPGQPPLRF